MEENNCIIHSTLEEGYDFHFKILSFLVPSGLSSEAIEVTNDGSPGYIFSILSDFDTETEEAEERLKEKIKKGINKRHIKKKRDSWEISDKQKLVGRVEWNDDDSDTEYENIFVIDGKRITFETFATMLRTFEGWQFKMEIIDPSNDPYE